MIAFGAGAGSFSILMGQVANKVPPQMRGTVSSVVNAGASFGRFLFAPVVYDLIVLPATGWRGAMYAPYALSAAGLSVIPVSLLITRPGVAPQTVQTASGGRQTLKQAFAQSFKNRSYILLHPGFLPALPYRLSGYAPAH